MKLAGTPGTPWRHILGEIRKLENSAHLFILYHKLTKFQLNWRTFFSTIHPPSIIHHPPPSVRHNKSILSLLLDFKSKNSIEGHYRQVNIFSAFRLKVEKLNRRSNREAVWLTFWYFLLISLSFIRFPFKFDLGPFYK